MSEDNNSSLPAADGYAPSLPDLDSATIESFLNFKFQAASEEFDRTMFYVNQAVSAERERCARIAESAPAALCLRDDCECHNAARADIAQKIRSGE